MPQASSLAATIEKALPVKPVLVEGRRGVFDVRVNGDLVFSKYDAHRFPEPDEIIEAVRARMT